MVLSTCHCLHLEYTLNTIFAFFPFKSSSEALRSSHAPLRQGCSLMFHIDPFQLFTLHYYRAYYYICTLFFVCLVLAFVFTPRWSSI